jgi:hypothetical protein
MRAKACEKFPEIAFDDITHDVLGPSWDELSEKRKARYEEKARQKASSSKRRKSPLKATSSPRRTSPYKHKTTPGTSIDGVTFETMTKEDYIRLRDELPNSHLKQFILDDWLRAKCEIDESFCDLLVSSPRRKSPPKAPSSPQLTYDGISFGDMTKQDYIRLTTKYANNPRIMGKLNDWLRRKCQVDVDFCKQLLSAMMFGSRRRRSQQKRRHSRRTLRRFSRTTKRF